MLKGRRDIFKEHSERVQDRFTSVFHVYQYIHELYQNQSSKMRSPNWCVIDNMAMYSPFSTYVVAWKHNVWLDVARSLTLNPLPLYVPYIRFRERYFKWKRNILLPLILAGFCCEVNTKLCFHSNLVTLYMGERKEQQLPRIQTLHLESCQRDRVL